MKVIVFVKATRSSVVGEGADRGPRGRYVNRETALMVPIVFVGNRVGKCHDRAAALSRRADQDPEEAYAGRGAALMILSSSCTS
jgi:hypothetical protein